MKKKILSIFLLWRLLLFVPILFASQLIPYRVGYAYTSPLYFIKGDGLVTHFLLSPWANFDGVYYLIIAANGYTVNAGFFPLFPLSIHIISSVFGNSLAFSPLQYLVGLILANGYFILALLVFYALARIDYKKGVAIKSIVFLLLFPTSFFFASIYSESLFLLLTVTAFYFARKKQWFLAAIAGGLLTATRFVGIAILPALLYELYVQEKHVLEMNSFNIRKLTKLIMKGLPLLLVPVGLVSYMVFNYYKWGNAFYFILAQGKLDNNRSVTSLVFIPQTVYRYIKILVGFFPSQFEWWVALLELCVFIFVCIMISYAWKKKVRFSYLLFSLICLIIPASTGTFTGLPRYALVLFPIFIALALIERKSIKVLYIIVSLILLVVLLVCFSRGYYIA